MLPVATDWIQRLRSRIFEQYKSSNFGPLLADSIGAGANQLNAAQIAMLSLFSIDPITDDTTSPAYGIGRGVQLDRLGRLVNQPRGTASDSVYRLLLRARILVNKSSGGPDQIIAIARAMFGNVGTPLIIPGWIAEYTVRLVGVVVNPLEVDSILALIGAATQAGTRAVVEYTFGTLTWNALVAGQVCGGFLPAIAAVAATGYVDDTGVAAYIDGDGFTIHDAGARVLNAYYNDGATFVPPANDGVTHWFLIGTSMVDNSFGNRLTVAVNGSAWINATAVKTNIHRSTITDGATGAAGNIAITSHNFATSGPISDGGWTLSGMSGGITADANPFTAGGGLGGAAEAA